VWRGYDGAVSDLGVVGPMRVPAPVAGIPARFRAFPMLAQAFIVIAIVDALVRTVGLIEPAARFNGPISAVGAYVPRDLWILLPAILLARRPTLAEDMPMLFRGTLAIALVTLVGQPALVLLTNTETFDSNLSLFAGLELVVGLAIAWAYVMLGLGLGRLNPRQPRPVVAGLGNLAGWAIVLGLGVQLLAGIALDAFSGTEPIIDLASLAAQLLTQVALAFFLRAVIRGMDDPSRAERATRIAAAGAVLLAVDVVFEAALSVLTAALQGSFAGQQTLVDISQWSSTVIAVVVLSGYVLLFVGFALGLADPLRPLAKDWEAAAAPA
jgi:hypothetical protein